LGLLLLLVLPVLALMISGLPPVLLGLDPYRGVSTAELVERAVLKAEVEDFVGLLLHREAVRLEEGEIFHQLGRFVEIGEDADAAALGGLEDRAEQADEVEGRKLALFGVKQDVFGEVGGKAGGWHGPRN
jgi:hypothetical protein